MDFVDGLANEEQIGNTKMKSILNITMLLIYTNPEIDYNAVIHCKIFTL